MVDNMGMKINHDEARVLLASANGNRNNKLLLNEFLDLIYNNQDALNVDISRISKLTKLETIEREELKKTGMIKRI